jgi:hypothetical protein
MAALFHSQQQPAGQGKIDQLEGEVRELKDRINHLILQHEDKRGLEERLSPPKVPDHLAR